MSLINALTHATKIMKFVDGDGGYPFVSDKLGALFNKPEEKPVDAYVPKDPGKQNNAEARIEASMQIQKYMDSIEASCRDSGVKVGDILAHLLKYGCMTKEEYDSRLTPREKEMLWEGFAKVVNHALKVKKSYGISSGTDLQTVIKQMLDVYQTDQAHDNIIKADDVLNLTGDINSEINKNIKDKSKEEKFEIFGKIYDSLKKKFDSFEEKRLSGLSGSEKEHQKELVEKTKDKAEKMRLLQLNMTQDAETAYSGLMSVSSKQLAWGTQALLDSRVSNEERMKVADKVMTFDNQADIIEGHVMRGDAPSQNIVRGMSTAAVAGMSKEGVTAYSERYFASRQNGEHKALEENGYYTQIAGGIGAGAALNSNLPDEVKSKFIENFLAKEERCFGDSAKVKQAIQEGINDYIKEYAKTHSAQEVAQLRSRISNIVNAIEKEISKTTIKSEEQKQTNNTGAKEAKEVVKKEIQKHIEERFPSLIKDGEGQPKDKTSTPSVTSGKKEVSDNNYVTKTIYGGVPKRPNADISEIKQTVLGGIPLPIAARMFNHKDFAKFCICDPCGSSFLPNLKETIINVHIEELVTWNASTCGYNFIINTLPVDKAEEYIKQKPTSSYLKDIAERRIEERKKEEYIGQKDESNEKHTV